jgi:hypothetical protein
MNNYDYYSYVKHDNNFLTGSGDETAQGDIVSSLDGTYTFYYHFLISRDELSWDTGYDVVTEGEDASDNNTQNIEYGLFVEGQNAVIESAFSYIMGNNTDLP